MDHVQRGLALCAALCAASLAPGQQWERQAPLPTGKDIYGAAFTSADHGFFCGVNRQLIRTRDGGKSWETVFSGDFTSDPFYNVHFFDARHGWVIGNNNDAHRTTDGGETWDRMLEVPAGSWREIDFFSPTSGVIGANGALAATSDGGVTWEVRSGYPDCPVIYGMDFRDEVVGLVSGDDLSGADLGVHRTADGGRTWTETLDLASNDVLFLEGDRAIATVYKDGYNEIHATTDAGLTWEHAAFFIEGGPEVDLELVGGNTVAGISFQGAIWLSTNGGSSWSQVAEPIGTLPYSWRLHFSDELHGYACGPAGLLRATEDGGFTWRTLTQGIGFDITDLDMFDDELGMAAAGNYVVRTRDGGASWSADRLQVTGPLFGRDESIAAVDFVDRNVAVAAGPGGVVFQTFDGGDSWYSIGYPELPAFDIEDVDFVSDAEGWVIGRAGLYHTVDGFYWEQALDFFGVRVQFLDADHGWMQMPGGRQFRTVNGGDTWEDRLLPDHPLHGGPIVEDMDFADLDHGWVVGWFGYVIRTTNGGVTWNLQDFGSPRVLGFGVRAISPAEAWVMGWEDDRRRVVVLHTTDGGVSWDREVIRGEEYALTEIEVGPSGGLWIGGFRGTILHKDAACAADCDGDGELTFFDFLCYQNLFSAADPAADCDGDGSLTFFDFLCFQNQFAAGCA
ncbi:MAG: YCF48-related protein [Phycisphaerales bacterium JB039]